MKILILAWKLFRKHLVLNLLMILELAAVTLIAVVTMNMVRSSTSCVETLQNSCDRVLYYVNPEHLSQGSDDSGTLVKDAAQSKTAFEKSLYGLMKDFKFVKGFSQYEYSFVSLDKSSLTGGKMKRNAYSDVITVDRETAKAIQYPLEAGKWFTTPAPDGCIPCVIGGVYSENYRIGQKITGYTYSGNGNNTVRTITFFVTGRLAKPEQVLDNCYSTNDPSFAASGLFASRLDAPLLLLAATGDTGAMPSTGFRAGNEYLYLDRSTTESQISALRQKLTSDCLFTDEQLIANEKKQLSQNLSILLPFMIILLIVSFFGIVSMCMLTTLRNMDTFKIYYLAGCPRRHTVLITGAYSFFYFVGAGVVFFAAMRFLYDRTADLLVKANLTLYPQTVLLIGLSVAGVCLLSFVVPFYILRRQNTADLLRTN